MQPPNANSLPASSNPSAGPDTTPDDATQQLPRSACQTDEWLRHLPAGSPAGSKAYNQHKYSFTPKIKTNPSGSSQRPSAESVRLPFSTRQPTSQHHPSVAPSGSYLNWKILQSCASRLAQPPLVMGECEYGKGLVVFNRSQTHTPGAAPGQRSLDDRGRFFRSCKPTVKMRCLLP
jgi:hypothetical protein